MPAPPTPSNQPAIPKVLKLIEPTDKVCILPDEEFFMMKGTIQQPDAFVYWSMSSMATVCPGINIITKDCSQNGDDVSMGPVVTMTVGGKKIEISPEEYLLKVDVDGKKKLKYGFSPYNLPRLGNGRNSPNLSQSFFGKNSPCPSGSVAIGKYFLGHRSWTIGSTFSKYTFTFGASKISGTQQPRKGKQDQNTEPSENYKL